jgi:hypothetical protein
MKLLEPVVGAPPFVLCPVRHLCLWISEVSVFPFSFGHSKSG